MVAAMQPIGAALTQQMAAAMQPIGVALTQQSQAITAMAAAMQPIAAAHYSAGPAGSSTGPATIPAADPVHAGQGHTEYHNLEEGDWMLSEDEDLGLSSEEQEIEPMNSGPQ